MRSVLLAIVFALAVALATVGLAKAEKWDGDCSTQGTATSFATTNLGSHTIGPGRTACFTFVDTATTDDLVTENSPVFEVSGGAALVCFDSDIGADAAGAATIDIRYCPHGALPAADPTFQCSLSTALSQVTCLTIDPGFYYFDITAVPAAASLDTARVTIRGLGSVGD